MVHFKETKKIASLMLQPFKTQYTLQLDPLNTFESQQKDGRCCLLQLITTLLAHVLHSWQGLVWREIIYDLLGQERHSHQ
jgi:hypothetical protein